MSEEYAGSVLSMLRYPVKSMMGEELTVADVTDCGFIGDRAYALIDNTTGKIASAKNPRKWARLFDCYANFIEPPRNGRPIPPLAFARPAAYGDLATAVLALLALTRLRKGVGTILVWAFNLLGTADLL